MNIKFIGTGSMISNDNQASYLVNNNIMVDFPQGTMKILKRNNLNEQIKYIFITHTHADHFFDLPFIILDFYQRKQKLNIVICKKDRMKVLKLLKLGFPGLFYEILLNKTINFIDNKKVIKIDNLTISSYKTVHGVMKNCYSYVFKYNDKKIVFTGDTTICDNLLDNIIDADYLICDVTNKIGNNFHLGVDDIKHFLNEYKNLKIIPSHMGKNSKKELLEIKNQNLIIKEDMEDLIVL